jgi:oligopeptide/dipeptide ABC transporter ATP-binding protein
LRREHHMAMLFITHDLGVVAQVCDRVGVMYAGQLVEVAPVSEIFAAPKHPYTRALLEALPGGAKEPGKLTVIDGQIPDLENPPPGCRFAPRCPHRMAVCEGRPDLTAIGVGRVACWLHPADNRSGDAVASTAEGHR